MAEKFLTQVGHTIFGKPDATKTGLVIRGILITFLIPALTASIDLIGQLTSQLHGTMPIVFEWRFIIRIYLDGLLPSVALWLTAAKAWMEGKEKETQAQLELQHASVAINRLVQIGINAPAGTRVEEVKAQFQAEKIIEMERNPENVT